MAQNYLRELIRCETCGKSYSDNYTTCPYCAAEEQAFQISRKRKKHTTSPLAVVAALVLLAGAAGIGYSTLSAGALSFGREYEVIKEDEIILPISSSVTQQRTQTSDVADVSDDENDTAAEPNATDAPEETDSLEEEE